MSDLSSMKSTNENPLITGYVEASKDAISSRVAVTGIWFNVLFSNPATFRFNSIKIVRFIEIFY